MHSLGHVTYFEILGLYISVSGKHRDCKFGVQIDCKARKPKMVK